MEPQTESQRVNPPVAEKTCTGTKEVPGCGKFFVPTQPNQKTCPECREKHLAQLEADRQKLEEKRRRDRERQQKHRDKEREAEQLSEPEVYFDVLIECAEHSRFRLGDERGPTTSVFMDKAMHHGIGLSPTFYGRKGLEADQDFNQRLYDLEEYLMNGGKLEHTRLHTEPECFYCVYFDSSKALAISRRFQHDILHEKSAQQLKEEFEALYGNVEHAA